MFRYWRVSLMIVVIAAAIAYGVSLTLPKRYEGSAAVELTDPGSGGVFQTTSLLPEDFARYTARQAVIFKSAAVAKEVAKEVKGLSINGYSKNVHVNATTPGLLVVKARADTALKAMVLANAATDGYQRVTASSSNQATNSALAAIDQSLVVLTANFDQLNRQLEAKPNDRLLQANLQGLIGDRGALTARRNELRVNKDAFGDGVTFLDPARRPSKPVEPQPIRNAGVAALFALLIAGVMAWIRADRHQAADDGTTPAEILNAPMLGAVPNFAPDEDMSAVSDGASAAAESYQYVAASLQHLFKWGVLLVTSASHGDGKTVSAASIAAAAARDGTRVVLVDADTRASTLTRRMLGAAEHRPAGLTDLAEGTTELGDVARFFPLDNGVFLPFVPAGSHTGNGGLFRTAGMANVLQTLRDSYDLIVVDTAALLAVADVASLAVHADGIVAIVSRGTPLALLQSVRQRLDLVGAPLVGYVFTFAEDETEPYLQSVASGGGSPKPRRRLLGRRRDSQKKSSGPTDGTGWRSPRLDPAVVARDGGKQNGARPNYEEINDLL